MDNEFHEQFLRANANLDHIAYRLADVLRDLMRAVAGGQGGAYSAAEGMDHIGELLQRCETPLGWGPLFAKAVENISSETQKDAFEDSYLRAAQDGLKFLVESSCDDNAARARASRRRQEFITSFERARDARRKNR